MVARRSCVSRWRRSGLGGAIFCGTCVDGLPILFATTPDSAFCSASLVTPLRKAIVTRERRTLLGFAGLSEPARFPAHVALLRQRAEDRAVSGAVQRAGRWRLVGSDAASVGARHHPAGHRRAGLRAAALAVLHGHLEATRADGGRQRPHGLASADPVARRARRLAGHHTAGGQRAAAGPRWRAALRGLLPHSACARHQQISRAARQACAAGLRGSLLAGIPPPPMWR